MKIKEIAKKSDKELEKLVSDTREKIAGFKRERYTADERNVRMAKNLRRDLARMLTELQGRSEADNSDASNKEDK